MTTTETNTPLRLHIPRLLRAVGTHEVVKVDRSTLFNTSWPRYQPVREFIEDNGLVLSDTTTEDDPSMIGGRCEVSWFMKPRDRMVWLMDLG